MAGADVRPLFDHSRPQAQPAKRPLPTNAAAENAVLGAILARNSTFDQVAGFLLPDHFSDDIHGRLYAEMSRLIVSGKTADPVTLNGWFRAQEDVSTLPMRPEAYLANLVSNGVVSLSITQYGEAIRDCYLRRAVILQAETLADSAYDFRVPVDQLTNDMTSAIDAAAFAEPEGGSKSFDQVLDETVTMAETPLEHGGNSWIHLRDFPRFTRLISFQPGQMTLLGGRQGEGKSALAFGWAVDAAREIRDLNLPLTTTGGIVCVSLDMPDQMVGARALAAVAGVDVNSIMERRVTAAQLDRLKEARDELQGLPLRVISGAGLTPSRIKMRLRQARRALGGKLRLILIDHFHIMGFEPAWVRNGDTFCYNRNANEIHGWCKPEQFDCHLLALVQLNIKDIAKRPDKTPTRADIRYSTDLVSNTDNIVFVYRPIMDESKTPPKPIPGEYANDHKERIKQWEDRREELRDVAMLVLDKARSADSEDTIPLLFDGRATRLTEDPRARQSHTHSDAEHHDGF